MTALDAAQELALDRLSAASNITSELRSEYRWARVAVESRLHPVAVSPTRLAALAGAYGTIRLRNTALGLRLYRPDREHWPQGALLTPLTNDGVFTVEGFDDTLRLRLTGSTLELLWASEDAPEVFRRA